MNPELENIPCLVCGALPERTGDFNDYLQCTDPDCSQRAFAIFQDCWPSLMTEKEKARAWKDSEK